MVTTLQPAYTDEHRLFASAVDEFVRRTVSPPAEQVDFDRELDPRTACHVWDMLRGQGSWMTSRGGVLPAAARLV
jgi:hypothetical protein